MPLLITDKAITMLSDRRYLQAGRVKGDLRGSRSHNPIRGERPRGMYLSPSRGHTVAFLRLSVLRVSFFDTNEPVVRPTDAPYA